MLEGENKELKLYWISNEADSIIRAVIDAIFANMRGEGTRVQEHKLSHIWHQTEWESNTTSHINERTRSKVNYRDLVQDWANPKPEGNFQTQQKDR